MTDDHSDKTCTVVLHDDTTSTEYVLCGENILSIGRIAQLISPGSKPLCIQGNAGATDADQVSVHISIAKVFGIDNRMKATVRLLDEVETVTATHVETVFRDQHLSRADMRRIKSQLDSTVLYADHKISYLGSVVATVEAIYISGRPVLSAAISPRTKLILRSLSARFTIMIQISKEMLETWRDGDLMYECMLSGFLPGLFHRWNTIKARHQVSLVLFGRRLSPQAPGSEVPSIHTNDFYHTVALDVPSHDWRPLLRKVKSAFNNGSVPRQVTLAKEGNMLEAIHLAAMDISNKFEPRLASTCTSVIAITAGTGVFKAEVDRLNSTTDLLLGSVIGVDIVHLASKPLHPVPLFQYVHDGNSEYALPHWVDASYWARRDTVHHSRWLLNDLRGEVTNVSLSPLPRSTKASDRKSIAQAMDDYDAFVFSDAGLIPEPDPNAARDKVVAPSSAVKDVPRSTDTPLKAVATVGFSQPTHAAKRDASNPRLLMQMNRKISAGPRGLTPSAGGAVTTISTEHAQQERDATSHPVPFTANESTSALTKQIKESLRSKPQRDITYENATKPVVASRDIDTAETQGQGKARHTERDPASLIEHAVMRPATSGKDDTTEPRTPHAKPHAPSLWPTQARIPVDKLHASHPWLTLKNPCYPRQDNMEVASEYRQWQNVFPRAIGVDVFKWKSMSNPASLPLIAERHFAIGDLDAYFSKTIRRLLVASSSLGTVYQSISHMVDLRLNAGFQIITLGEGHIVQVPSEVNEKILLSLGDRYHEICYLSPSEIQATEYSRFRSSVGPAELSISDSTPYEANVKPSISYKERRVSVNLEAMFRDDRWPILDDYCVNGGILPEAQGSYCVRFVLIPVDPPQRGTGQSVSATKELSDDERRLEGIQKLTQIWQRHRYLNEESQRHQKQMVKAKVPGVAERDPNPLAVEYQTRDTSTVVAAFGISTTGNADGYPATRLFAESEQYHSSNFDIVRLARQMQELPPEGVEFKDRRWFTRLHLKCFRGDEMTNWLLRVFKDLHTRDDAIALGNQLMSREIFTHVRGTHDFRDGNYFYQIKAAHRTTEYPDTTSFFSKPLGWPSPTTPMAEHKHYPLGAAAHSGSEAVANDVRTPTLGPTDRKRRREVVLSQKMQYNADPGKRSSKLEIVNLHYDRIHNPENCYNIFLDWTNTTSKLIREGVSRWSAVAESHGLRLVQVPVQEASKVHERHPFEQSVLVKLAVAPTQDSLATPQLDAQALSPPRAADSEAYHKAILRKCGFALDTEAAHRFPKSVDVTYSWSRPDYQYTQFIHKSGLLLVQIVNDSKCDFLLLPNRLGQHTTSSVNRGAELPALQTIVQGFVSFCRDTKALHALYEEIRDPKVSIMSPATDATSLDNDIPPMELPQLLSHRAVLKRVQ